MSENDMHHILHCIQDILLYNYLVVGKTFGFVDTDS